MAELNETLTGFELSSDTGASPAHRLERTSSRSMCAMALSVAWHSDIARHTDQRIARELNLWRDILPFELEPELMDKPVGHVARRYFAAGRLIVPYQADRCFNVGQRAFHRGLRRHSIVEPRAGRFYPRAFINGSRGIFADEMQPFRVGNVSGDMLCCDLNNPLSNKALDVSVQILDIWAAEKEPARTCNDVAELMTHDGPGMQSRWRGQPPDFWQDGPFARVDGGDDAAFYAGPRLVSHVDRTASREMARLYRRLLPAGGRVLDLMASWQSHLAEDHGLGRIVGLGMNAEELAANPVFGAYRVHDLNTTPRLPHGDAEFDAVICSLSIEYLVRPFDVFAEVARVLRPGGRFVVTFSNRWFPSKAIAAWKALHTFERLGLVLEYFHRDGLFTDLETWSLRGLPRPTDDRYAGKLADADPVFAVWGSRR
ncbi:MAG: methyltransferase domain-containing protein [Gammaproteobacteria bacterium]|nr:methyltransferase domain-containing protein [Gammaproteobacteria bacterium]